MNNKKSAITDSGLNSSGGEGELSEKENTDTKSGDSLNECDNVGSGIPNGDMEIEHSVKIETDSVGRITRSESRTPCFQFGRMAAKSDVDSDLDDHNTSSESLNVHMNTRSNDEHKHETCTNRSSPSSTEGVRENSTPDLPIQVPSSPLPVLPESGSDSVSPSISEDVPSLTQQIPTPHSLESGVDYPHSMDESLTAQIPTPHSLESGVDYPHSMDDSNMNSPSIQSPRSCVPSPTPSPIPLDPACREEERDELGEEDNKLVKTEREHENPEPDSEQKDLDNMAAGSSDDVLGNVERTVSDDMLVGMDRTSTEDVLGVDSILSPVNVDTSLQTCEQIMADSSAIASSDLVAEMENSMNNSNEEIDEIDNNSTADIPSDDNFQDLDSDTTTQEALRATENLEQVIAAEDLESSLEQMEESTNTASVTAEPIASIPHEETVNVASVGSHGSASVHSVEHQPMSDPPNPSPRHPHPSPHNTVSPHHPSPHHPGPSPHLPSPHHTMSPHPNLSPQCMNIGQQMFSPNQQMNPMPNASINTTRFGNEIDVTQLAGLESPASISSNEMQNTSGENLQPPPHPNIIINSNNKPHPHLNNSR